jgi:hypothetical protein
VTNPYLERQAKAAKNSHGKVSEKRLSQKLGSQLTPASGALRGAKGDSKRLGPMGKELIESKSTTALTLAVDLGWLVKIVHEARGINARPLLTMSFVTPDGKPRPSGDWMAMPMDDYEELMERLNGL